MPLVTNSVLSLSGIPARQLSFIQITDTRKIPSPSKPINNPVNLAPTGRQLNPTTASYDCGKKLNRHNTKSCCTHQYFNCLRSLFFSTSFLSSLYAFSFLLYLFNKINGIKNSQNYHYLNKKR